MCLLSAVFWGQMLALIFTWSPDSLKQRCHHSPGIVSVYVSVCVYVYMCGYMLEFIQEEAWSVSQLCSAP